VQPQRQFPRYALEAAVTLLCGPRSLRGRTSNLSRGGLCATFAENLAIGGRVDVELALVFENDALSEPLSLRARVVWCTAFEQRYQVGLAFLPTPGDAGRFLDMFLEFLAEGRRSRAVANGGPVDPFE